MKKLTVGVDLGGTKILLGLVTETGKIVKKKLVLTPKDKDWKKSLNLLSDEIHSIVQKSRYSWDNISGIGIACAGTIDRTKKKILHSPNLNWKNVPVMQFVQKSFKVPIILENDVSAGAYAVYCFGEGQKSKTLLCIFVGTGIGGGLVINGKLFTGFNGTAGEIGHMIVDLQGPHCNCGNDGCWETLASRSALELKINKHLEIHGKDVPAYKHMKRMKHKGKALIRAYHDDFYVRKTVKEMGRVLGIGIANLGNIIGPDVVVLGGGMIEDFEQYLLPDIIKTARHYAMAGVLNGVKIISTQLGNNASMLGGAALAQEL